MNKKSCGIICIGIVLLFGAQPQAREKLPARIRVHSEQIDRFNTPFKPALEGLNINRDNGKLNLFDFDEKQSKAVTRQLEPESSARMLWSLLFPTKAIIE